MPKRDEVKEVDAQVDCPACSGSGEVGCPMCGRVGTRKCLGSCYGFEGAHVHPCDLCGETRDIQCAACKGEGTLDVMVKAKVSQDDVYLDPDEFDLEVDVEFVGE